MRQDETNSSANPSHYAIQVGGPELHYKRIELEDPVPTGRQVLLAAGFPDEDGCVLCAILGTGDFEEVRLNETFDLRAPGVERFIVFRTDRTYRLMLNGHQLLWGEATLQGAVLYTLGQVGPDDAVYADVQGGTDRLIEPTDVIDLSKPEVERFITAKRPDPGYEIIVNTREEVVPSARVTFEQVVQLAFPGATEEAAVCFSMTFRHASSIPHSGELSRGGVVEVKRKGTVFNVTRTVQS